MGEERPRKRTQQRKCSDPESITGIQKSPCHPVHGLHHATKSDGREHRLPFPPEKAEKLQEPGLRKGRVPNGGKVGSFQSSDLLSQKGEARREVPSLETESSPPSS